VNKQKRIKRLYLSEHDSQIAGVCGGLADYFNIDSTWVRLAFIIFALTTSIGFWVYILLWIILPDEEDLKQTSSVQTRLVTADPIQDTDDRDIHIIREAQNRLRKQP